MGIPGFYSWLIEKYRNIVIPCQEGKPYTLFDNLYLDMNQIIHKCAQSKRNQPQKEDIEIIELIFCYIDRIFSIIHPRQILYLAIDGVTPRARMTHQRSKQFLQSRNIFDGIEEKFLTEKSQQQEATENFDKCHIKPGTKFMCKISEYLRYYIHYSMNTKLAWKRLKVILSDGNVPGEGEHKIAQFIRRQTAHSDTYHVVYGSDSDLILLGLATHQPNLRIICEICENCNKIGHGVKECSKSKRNQINGTSSNNMKTKYIFVDFSILRENLYFELRKHNQFLPRWNLESFIDDWVFICLLLGNDFLLNSPSINLSTRSMGHLIRIYKHTVTQFGWYLTNNSVPNIECVVAFLKNISKEFENEKDSCQQYYQDKFINEDNLENISIDEVVTHYVQGLCWIFQYYYQGPPSWDWYYPHYYAPLAFDFSNLKNVNVNFNKNTQPFSPLQQMMATFSPQNAEHLPAQWSRLMLDEKSPIIKYYPKNFYIDPNDKYRKSEYVVLLPFINENILLETLEKENVYSTLTIEELKRNRRDYDRLFIHSTNSFYQQFKNIYNYYNKENPVQINGLTRNDVLTGYIWPDDNENIIRIDEEIKARIPNYTNILNNQVICVKHRDAL